MSKRHVGRHRAPMPNPLRRRSVPARSTRPALAAGVLLASSSVIASVAPPAVADPTPPSDVVVTGEPAYDDPSEQGDYTSPRPAPQDEPDDESTAPPQDEERPDPQTSSSPTASPTATPTRSASSTKAPPSTKAPTSKKASPAKKAAPAKKAKASAGSAERAVGAEVVSIASGLTGISYRWGGTTTSGFDCSGFTRYVYRKAGISLPRTAAQQQRATRRVSDPRPGDLVFFGSPAHHVGIYAGNGKMYDAPRSGRTTGLHKIWSKNVSYGRVR